MLLALIGSPLSGQLIDKWRKREPRARLLFPVITTTISAILLFVALRLTGTIQMVILFTFGIFIMMFLAGAVAVTQDVIHPGLRATSYAIAVVVQNLLGSFMAPIVLGKISDLSNIATALSILPFMLLLGAFLFYLGSRHYLKDLEKVTKVELVPEG
jgi:MFS family permease